MRLMKSKGLRASACLLFKSIGSSFTNVEKNYHIDKCWVWFGLLQRQRESVAQSTNLLLMI